MTAMTSGAVADYTTSEVRDTDGNVQVTTMSQNAQYDGDRGPISLATFMDYDEWDEDFVRIPFAEQDAADIQEVANENLFTFDLTYTGKGDVNVNETVAVWDADGTGLSASSLADEFDGTGNAFSVNAAGGIKQLSGKWTTQ